MLKSTIFFSSIKEANSLLYQSSINFTKQASNKFYSITDQIDLEIIITGIGKANTLKALNIFQNNPDIIIKAGTCALLDKKINFGIPTIPSSVSYNGKKLQLNFSNFPKSILNKINPLIANESLITLDNPLMNKNTANNYFNQGYSLADMETFFIAERFYKEIPFFPILVGTDIGDISAKAMFIKNLSNASLTLSKTISNIFNL